MMNKYNGYAMMWNESSPLSGALDVEKDNFLQLLFVIWLGRCGAHFRHDHFHFPLQWQGSIYKSNKAIYISTSMLRFDRLV